MEYYIKAVLALGAALAALYFITINCRVRVKKKRSSVIMPAHGLIYADNKTDGKNLKIPFGSLLKSEKYKIKGKPDYIFKAHIGGWLVPVELKSGQIKNAKRPKEGDMLQLIAYFIIINEVYGVKPPYGKLVYSDYMFIIKNTWGARRKVIRRVKRMRRMLITGADRHKENPNECKHCICRNSVCEYYNGGKND